MQLDELFIKLCFKTDKTELNDFSKSADNAKVNLLGIVAATTAAVVAIEKVAEATAHAVNNLQNFNAQTGLSIGKLQNMQITGQLQNIGLSANDIGQSVQALQSNLANIRLGQGNVAPFQMMGIDVMGQNAFGVIDQIRERIKGLDDMTATNLIQQMGLNPQMITMLRMSKDEFAGLNSQIALTYDERKNIQELGVEIKKTQLLIEGAINKTIAKWTPALKSIAQFIQNIVFAIKRLNLTLPIMIVSLTGVLKMFKLLNKQTLAWTAGLMALFLLLDDYAVWAQGGKSLFDYTGMQKFFDALDKNLAKLDKHINSLKILTELGTFAAPTLMGAQIGSVFGPYGTVAGAGAGAGVGAYLAWKEHQAMNSNTSVGVNISGAYNNSTPMQSKPSNITQNNNINIHSSAASGKDVASNLQNPLNAATQAMVNRGESH